METTKLILSAMILTSSFIGAMEHKNAKTAKPCAINDSSEETKKLKEEARDLYISCKNDVQLKNAGTLSLRAILALLGIKAIIDVRHEYQQGHKSGLYLPVDTLLALMSFVCAYSMTASLYERAYSHAHGMPFAVKKILDNAEACKDLPPDMLNGMRAGFRDAGGVLS